MTEHDKGLWEKTKDVSAEAWDKTKDTTAKAWDKTKEVSAKAWDKTRDAFSDDDDDKKEDEMEDVEHPMYNKEQGCSRTRFGGRW